MKLVYQIPNKLYYIQNFLDYPTYKKLHYDVFRSKLINLQSVKNEWLPFLLENYKNSPHTSPLTPNYKPFQKLKILLENNPFIKIKLNESMPYTLHSMSDESGINWHSDYGYQYGITYYINKRWNTMSGGEFMFSDEQNHGWLPVVGNSVVIVKTPLWHKVNPVMKPLVPRKTIQIFIPNA